MLDTELAPGGQAIGGRRFAFRDPDVRSRLCPSAASAQPLKRPVALEPQPPAGKIVPTLLDPGPER